MRRCLNLLSVSILLTGAVLGAESKTDEKSLTLRSLRHFQIAIERGLFAVHRSGDEVYTSARQARFYIRSSYNAQAKESDLGFGDLMSPVAGSERVNLAEGERERRIRGILPVGDLLLLLDSSQRQVLVWNTKEKIWHTPADLILDLLRPPADRGGEAPRSEVLRLRARFQQSYTRIQGDPDLIAGMAAMPRFWTETDDAQFLILLRLPETSLLSVRCEGRNLGRCMAVRSCFIPRFIHEAGDEPTGLAVHEQRREIWIGQAQKMKIMRFSAPSCYRIQRAGTLGVPKELRRLSNLFIDSEANLWVTNGEPDPVHSASLFRWDARTIEPLLVP